VASLEADVLQVDPDQALDRRLDRPAGKVQPVQDPGENTDLLQARRLDRHLVVPGMDEADDEVPVAARREYRDVRREADLQPRSARGEEDRALHGITGIRSGRGACSDSDGS
jgi:hypothetical protein